jgi:hypothetical protein
MAYSETIELVQGDRLPQLTFTLRDQNTAAAGKTLDPDDPSTWAPFNLTGGSVQLHIRIAGSSAIKETLTGVLTDPANGVVTFVFSATTLSDEGIYEAEIEYTNSGGLNQTIYDLVRFKVRAQF